MRKLISSDRQKKYICDVRIFLHQETFGEHIVHFVFNWHYRAVKITV